MQQLTRTLHESFVHSFRLVMLIASITALLGAVCAALTIRDAQPEIEDAGRRRERP